jgi:L-alanine-DL-glutamate epimerase-like enolase superfamily enzyme
MSGYRLSPRNRRFVLWVAKLALVAYIVQIMAVDHWQVDVSHITGVEGTASHAHHCHGGGDCSSGGGGAVSTALTTAAQTPLPPAPTIADVVSSERIPASVIPSIPFEPPQAA